jgi:hypothetical protein
LAKHERSEFDVARDELMSHIHRCGVLKASTEQQDLWLDDTVEYMAERYESLTEAQLQELRQIGRRFCQPVIARGDSAGSSEESEQGELAGAA